MKSHFRNCERWREEDMVADAATGESGEGGSSPDPGGRSYDGGYM